MEKMEKMEDLVGFIRMKIFRDGNTSNILKTKDIEIIISGYQNNNGTIKFPFEFKYPLEFLNENIGIRLYSICETFIDFTSRSIRNDIIKKNFLLEQKSDLMNKITLANMFSSSSLDNNAKVIADDTKSDSKEKTEKTIPFELIGKNSIMHHFHCNIYLTFKSFPNRFEIIGGYVEIKKEDWIEIHKRYELFHLSLDSSKYCTFLEKK